LLVKLSNTSRSTISPSSQSWTELTTSVHLLSRYFGYTGYLSWSIILEALRSTGELVKEYILLGLLGLCLVVFFWVSLQLVGNILRIILGA
jgi:hypothetical protein